VNAPVEHKFPGAAAWTAEYWQGTSMGSRFHLAACDGAANLARLAARFPATVELLERLDAGYDLACASGFAYDAARRRFGRAFPGDGNRPPLPILRIPARVSSSK
jgi:hypothetical protein